MSTDTMVSHDTDSPQETNEPISWFIVIRRDDATHCLVYPYNDLEVAEGYLWFLSDYNYAHYENQGYTRKYADDHSAIGIFTDFELATVLQMQFPEYQAFAERADFRSKLSQAALEADGAGGGA